MKISTAYRSAIVAACALAILVPAQASAADAPACATENVAYLRAQDKQEDAETQTTAARQAV